MSTLFNLPRIDEDKYFCGYCTCMNDPATGEPLLPADVVNADAPEEDGKHWYKWDGAKWAAEAKPTTCAECVTLGAVSHKSQTARCAELRQIYQALVEAASEHFKITRGDELEWIVEAIPEKTEEEKLAEATEEARAKRDRLLAETDYLMASDYPISDEDREKVKAYRQALRDVPEQEGFPYTIVWPEKPEITKTTEAE